MRAAYHGCVSRGARHDGVRDAGLNHRLRNGAYRAEDAIAGNRDGLSGADIYALSSAGCCRDNIQRCDANDAGIDDHFSRVRRDLDVEIGPDYAQRCMRSIGLKFRVWLGELYDLLANPAQQQLQAGLL